jgi:hypothetical protein
MILAGMTLGLGLGLSFGNLAVPVVVVACAVGAIWFCHARVTEVMTDDMESDISGKAALRALEVTVIVAAVGFAIGMGFFFSGGWGNGMHGFNNGSVLVSVSQHAPQYQLLFHETYLISDPANLTMDDILALDRMSADARQARVIPLAFGVGLGFVVVLLVGLYAAFSYYYTKSYEE